MTLPLTFAPKCPDQKKKRASWFFTLVLHHLPSIVAFEPSEYHIAGLSRCFYLCCVIWSFCYKEARILFNIVLQRHLSAMICTVNMLTYIKCTCINYNLSSHSGFSTFHFLHLVDWQTFKTANLLPFSLQFCSDYSGIHAVLFDYSKIIYNSNKPNSDVHKLHWAQSGKLHVPSTSQRTLTVLWCCKQFS